LRKNEDNKKEKIMSEQTGSLPFFEIAQQPVGESSTFVPLPIVHAVAGADEILGKGRVWSSINLIQEWFLKALFNQCLGDISKLTDEEIKRKVSWVAAELNKFLSDNGFQIELQEFGKDEFGVVSILKIKVKWLDEGKKIEINSNNQDFEGVLLKTGVNIYKAGDYPNSIAQVTTQNGDVVWMSIADKPRGNFDLLSFSNYLNSSSLVPDSRYNGVEFPMINLNHQVDISWLVGMKTSDEQDMPWKISQALQQTKFRMNQKGAIAESAVAIGVKCLSIEVRPPLCIDNPFFVAITRQGCVKPLFISYCSWDVWANPGESDLD